LQKYHVPKSSRFRLAETVSPRVDTPFGFSLVCDWFFRLRAFFWNCLPGELMMRCLPCGVLAVAAAVGIASAARAADIPARAPAYAAPGLVAPFSWNGFYLGAQAGGTWGRSESVDNPDRIANRTWNTTRDTFTAQTSGLAGGVQAGHNWQWNTLVAGIEGDIGYLGFRGSKASSVSSDTIVSADGGAYGTLRGRLGVAWDRALLYGTGGLIVANVKASVDDNARSPGGGLMNSPHTGTQAGWTAGAGFEYAFGNRWSMKAEWLYFDLGTETVAGPSVNSTPIRFTIKNTGSIALVGLNFKL
jgi:outer membrane immunogenic protein